MDSAEPIMMADDLLKPSFTSILENLSVSVMLFDRKLSLIYINPAGEAMLDASASHLLGRAVGKLFRCLDEPVEEKLARVLREGATFTEREAEVALPHQRRIRVNCTVTPIGKSGSSGALLVEMQQVDLQMRLLREDYLLAQEKATRALMGGLAHEIKNPLGGLRGAAQLLERELPDSALREYTQVIIDEADRLRELVDRMPGRARQEGRESVNIHRLLEHVRLLVEAEDGGLVITTDYDPSIPELNANADQLVQAFLNIVRNAKQAVEGRGRIVLKSRVQRGLTINHRRHRLVAQVKVIDDGPGIPREMLERIFFPMVTTRAEGSGLGLPIAQSVAHEHHGLVECESRPGRTVFTILLPVEDGSD